MVACVKATRGAGQVACVESRTARPRSPDREARTARQKIKVAETRGGGDAAAQRRICERQKSFECLDRVRGSHKKDAAVKEKLDNYQDDYNERPFFSLPAVMTTSVRISGDFRLLYVRSHCQAGNYFTRMCILYPSPPAIKQGRGTYFDCNRAAIGLACARTF